VHGQVSAACGRHAQVARPEHRRETTSLAVSFCPQAAMLGDIERREPIDQRFETILDLIERAKLKSLQSIGETSWILAGSEKQCYVKWPRGG
jgi:hypothetical protein